MLINLIFIIIQHNTTDLFQVIGNVMIKFTYGNIIHETDTAFILFIFVIYFITLITFL